MIEEGALLWSPPTELADNSNLARYMRWLEGRGRAFKTYDALWNWSVKEQDSFWASIWDYFEVASDTPYSRVRSDNPMPGTRWFEGARVNLVEHILRNETRLPADAVAIHHLSEFRPLESLTWPELGARVRSTATALRTMGVGPGDRVAACLPNIVEAAVAMLAVAAIGGVWTAVAPEFGLRAAVDRLGQVGPKVLFVTDGYRYAGQIHRCDDTTDGLLDAVDTIERVVWVPNLDEGAACPADPRFISWAEVAATAAPASQDFRFERVPSDHPLWVLFTSGTTGLPKPIVHGQVGITLELLRSQSLSVNVGPGSTLFNFASTAWVVWNMLVGSLITGTAIVLYDGHPLANGPGTVWEIAQRTGTTDLGFSPSLVHRMMQDGVVPGQEYDLSALNHVILVGSPASPDIYDWLNTAVKPGLWVTSQAGSTEMCAGFAGGVPILPVRAGEIQARLLGMALECWSDNGAAIVDEVGELVVTAPCPMMPIGLWNDCGNRRYTESYFSDFPGVWRQGDQCRITPQGGLVILGRSDATLNRGGVRIGTAEIYRVVCNLAEIEDAIAVETAVDGQSRLVLFVSLCGADAVDVPLCNRIAEQLRTEYSPRHVPDMIFAAPAIPYTATGKRMEIPLRRLLDGVDPQKAGDRNAMADPTVFDWYAAFAQEFRQAHTGACQAMTA